MSILKAPQKLASQFYEGLKKWICNLWPPQNLQHNFMKV